MGIREVWAVVRDFFSHARLEEARRRHERAADRLDQAVKELLKK
jgi:hypothetical protein